MAEVLAVLGGASAVLELSTAAYSLAQTLCTFCKTSKLVNGNLRELAAEVNSLGNTCSVVHNVLVSARERVRGQRLWRRYSPHYSLGTCANASARVQENN